MGAIVHAQPECSAIFGLPPSYSFHELAEIVAEAPLAYEMARTDMKERRMTMTKYIDAYGDTRAPKFLWDMMLQALEEPHTTISHTAMPTWAEHQRWLENRTLRALLLIQAEDGQLVGFVNLTYQNEIGVRIAKGHRGKRYGQDAVEHVLEHFEPLEAQPGVRRDRFLANINPANAASIALFTKLGANHIQNTYLFDK